MALISIEEVSELASKHIPKIAQKHPGIKLLLQFVGKTVRAVNALDARLKRVEKILTKELSELKQSQEKDNA